MPQRAPYDGRAAEPRAAAQRVDSPRPEPTRPAAQAVPTRAAAPVRPVAPAAPAARAPARDDMEEALRRELEVSFDERPTSPPATPAQPTRGTLDDEMTKLLGELSSQKR